MSDILKKIQNDALSLSGQKRAFEADTLFSSLNDDVLTEVDTARMEEAEHRYQEYKAGKRQGVSAKDVFEEADSVIEHQRCL